MKAEYIVPAVFDLIPEKVTQRKPHAVLRSYRKRLYKHCANCKEWLPASKFYRNARRWDKLDYYCKECRDEHSHRR